MAGRKKGGEKGGTPVLDNDFSTEDAQEFFDKLAEINGRMKEDAAAGRGDINAVYDAMVAKLGVDKESAKFLWNRHSAEEKFRERAKKLDTASRKSLERFASQMEGTPFGDFATMALEDAADGKASVKSSKKKEAEPKTAEPEKAKADA